MNELWKIVRMRVTHFQNAFHSTSTAVSNSLKSVFFCVQAGTEVVELTQNSKLNLAKIGVDVLYKQILLSLGQNTKSNKRGEVGKVSSYQTDHQPFSKTHLLESNQIARRYTNWQLRIGNLALACFCAQTLKINPQ